MISYELYCQIQLYYKERGLSFAQIGRELNLDEETVAKWVRQKTYCRHLRARRKSKLDPYKPIIQRWLEQHPYSAAQIFQRLRAEQARVSRLIRPGDDVEGLLGAGFPERLDGGELGRLIADKILEHRELGYQIVGFVDDYLGVRMISSPLRLFDFCLETDNATCLIVTSAERARDLQRRLELPLLVEVLLGHQQIGERTDWRPRRLHIAKHPGMRVLTAKRNDRFAKYIQQRIEIGSFDRKLQVEPASNLA